MHISNRMPKLMQDNTPLIGRDVRGVEHPAKIHGLSSFWNGGVQCVLPRVRPRPDPGLERDTDHGCRCVRDEHELEVHVIFPFPCDGLDFVLLVGRSSEGADETDGEGLRERESH